MNVGVIGYGVVGIATAEVVRRLGHRVMVRDVDSIREQRAVAAGCESLDGRSAELDVLFICVPETKVDEALASMPACPLTVVRSTVPPGTTAQASRRLGRPLAFVPEFLKEATAVWDALNPSFILIGCENDEDGQLLSRLFSPLGAPVILTDTTTAEMVKITMNTYLHTLISFWNEIHQVCEKIGVSSHVVGMLCSRDPRVSRYGAVMHGAPAGGRCLPKDIAQLVAMADEQDWDLPLIRAVQEVNHRIGARTTNGVYPAPTPNTFVLDGALAAPGGSD